MVNCKTIIVLFFFVVSIVYWLSAVCMHILYSLMFQQHQFYWILFVCLFVRSFSFVACDEKPGQELIGFATIDFVYLNQSFLCSNCCWAVSIVRNKKPIIYISDIQEFDGDNYPLVFFSPNFTNQCVKCIIDVMPKCRRCFVKWTTELRC